MVHVHGLHIIRSKRGGYTGFQDWIEKKKRVSLNIESKQEESSTRRQNKLTDEQLHQTPEQLV